MLDKKDAQWWILEAQKHPESAVDLIRLLADRLAFLDKQNEELRGELTLLRRKQRGDAAADAEALAQRVQELESALREGTTGARLLVYARERIEAILPLGTASNGTGDGRREMPGDVAILPCNVSSKLLILTAEAQVFSLALTELPTPTDGPAPLGNPRNVSAILDQAVFERCRFLSLVSEKGYVYSVLAGTVSQAARKADRLIRHLIPEDPIVAAVPSYNAELVAVSRKGRVIRFPERAIAGAGSLIMQLPKDDQVVGVAALRNESNVVFLTDDGQILLRASGDIPQRKTPGLSTPIMVKGVGLRGVGVGEEIVALTSHGQVLTARLVELPYKAQTEAGAVLPGLPSGDFIVAWHVR